MASRRVTTILCAAEPRGSVSAVERLVEIAGERDVDAIALVGDLGDGHGSPESYRAIFRALGASGLPSYFVPGPGDAPVVDYLREAQNVEIVFPLLHGVHGTAAFAGAHVLCAGFGGEVSDDPDAPREEIERLAYPRWEPEYHLKLIRELDEHQLVLLLWTPPAHKGLNAPGSEVLAELVATHRPRLVVCGGERATETLGRSHVVAPGSLADGHYAIADLHRREVELEELAAAAG
jgi:Icc-related predicted phosphoesterase